MNDRNGRVKNFIQLVNEMRQAQKDPATGWSRNAQAKVARLEREVDAWIRSYAIEKERLAAFAGQKEN